MQDRRLSPLLLVPIVVIAVGMALVGFFWLGGPSVPAPVAASNSPSCAAHTGPGAPRPKPDKRQASLQRAERAVIMGVCSGRAAARETDPARVPGQLSRFSAGRYYPIG